MVCEPFTQWVLEDDFSHGRPPFEDGRRAGRRRRRAVRADEAAAAQRQPPGAVLLRLPRRATATSTRSPRTRRSPRSCAPTWTTRRRRRCCRCRASTSTRYKSELIERFSNPEIRDTLARLCAESSDRIPKWLLPVLRQNLATGGPIAHTAAVVASWARYAEGVDEQGEPIEVVDRLADTVTELARRYPDQPLALVGIGRAVRRPRRRRAVPGGLPECPAQPARRRRRAVRST